MARVDKESVLGKARLILGAFDAESPVLGLSELARRTQLAKTTVLRLVTEMVQVGFLNRRGRRYELGPLLFELGQRVQRTRQLRLIAARYLEDLARSTGETVVLAYAGDNEVLFLEKYFSRRGGGVTVTQVEGRVPFHCGASGKALLAFGDAELRERILAAPLRRKTPWTITDAAQLRAELEKTRRQGFAVDRQELVVGFGAVSVPIMIGDLAAATLTVVGPISRIDVARLAPEMIAVGRTLARDFQTAGF